MLIAAPAQEKSKYPEWSGQWTRVPMAARPRYDPSKPIRKQEAPLKPEYHARLEASMKDQDEGGQGLDMAYSCRPPGMPRMMSGVARMEFLVAPDMTRILFDRNDYAPRRIYTDGRDWPKFNPDDTTFPGYSIGKWVDTDGDGRYDELQVETRHVRGPRTWIKAACRWPMTPRASSRSGSSSTRRRGTSLHNEIVTTDNSLTRP
jgi:hypothetical protein